VSLRKYRTMHKFITVLLVCRFLVLFGEWLARGGVGVTFGFAAEHA
jgi:hypothetical protein